MAGNSSTVLFQGTGGDSIYNEDVGGAPVIHMPATKIHTGALGVDGGAVTVTNPLFAELSDGTNPVGTSGNPLFAKLVGQSQQATANSSTIVSASDHTVRIIDSAPGGVGWSDFATVINVCSSSTTLVASGAGRLLGALRLFSPNAVGINIAIFNGAGVWGTGTNLIDYFILGVGNSTRVEYPKGGVGCANGLTILASTNTWTVALAAVATAIVINGRST